MAILAQTISELYDNDAPTVSTSAYTPAAVATIQFDAALLQATSRAKAAYPTEAVRIERGLQIAIVGGVTLLPDGTAEVQSQTHDNITYRVNGHCSCVDIDHAPAGRCKHRWAKSLVKWALKQEDAPTVTHCPTCFLALEEDEVDCSCAHLAPEQSPLPIPEPTIAPEHIVDLHGKRFVLYAGLLQLAHARGLQSLTCEWTYNDGTLSLAKAVAVFPFGRFEECGDASPDNVTKKVAPHFRRVALTRAKARVLRDALNVDMVSLEELSE